MIRLLFRLLAMVALAVAVIMAVLDATRSIAASGIVMTPLASAWTAVSPDTLSALQAFVTERLGPVAWDPVLVQLLDLPGFAIFAVLAFLFYAIGRRRERPVGRLLA
jgi:hypothetical protein